MITNLRTTINLCSAAALYSYAACVGLGLAARAAHHRERRSVIWSVPVTLGAWGCFVLAVYLWGDALNAGTSTKVFAPPLFGRFDVRISSDVLPALLVAATVVASGPRLARSASWRTLLTATMATAIAWAVALALIDGPAALTAPLESRHDYLSNLPLISGDWLATYTAELGRYSIHAQGHPPGALLFFHALQTVGLGGTGVAASIAIIAGASAGPAALLVTKSVATESHARRAAPFVALTPAAIWIATSADALFLGIGAWGIAALVAGLRMEGHRSDAAALAGGTILGAGLFMSYGLAPLGLTVITLGAAYRRLRPMIMGALGVIAVTAAFAVAGFWWFEGLSATTERYHMGVASQRPYSYFAVANLAAFSLALGPAVVIALAYLRDGRQWLISGATLAAVAVADLSGLSKGEVERIWLPFVPWLTMAAASIPAPQLRTLLAVQASIGLMIGVGIRTPW